MPIAVASSALENIARTLSDESRPSSARAERPPAMIRPTTEITILRRKGCIGAPF
jgi:hypothetical protein